MADEIMVAGHMRRSKRGTPSFVSTHARRAPRGRFVSSGKPDFQYAGDAAGYRDLSLSPREFLHLVHGEGRSAEWFKNDYFDNDPIFGALEARMREGKDLDMPSLLVGTNPDYTGAATPNTRSYRIVGHEGRHRSASAALLGIPRIRVRVYYTRGVDPDEFNKLHTINTRVVRPQWRE